MPCYEVNEFEIVWQNTDETIFDATMKEAGFKQLRARTYVQGRTVIERSSQGLTITNYDGNEQMLEQQLRVMYAKQTVRATAKRQGWQITSQTSNKMRLER